MKYLRLMKLWLGSVSGITLFLSTSLQAGDIVNYQVNGVSYKGYYSSPADDAPLVLLVHDWDGLTDYEIKRAEMLTDMGYSVFAADLFGDRKSVV